MGQVILPKINPEIDPDTKGLIELLANVKRHGFCKIIYKIHGEYYTPVYEKDGTPALKKDGSQKRSKGGFLKTYSDRTKKEKRPIQILQPDGGYKSAKELTALCTSVFNVGHEYGKMIKNQLVKLGKNPDEFDPDACKYSKRFSPNGLVRQHINPSKENTFYFRYFTDVNEITKAKFDIVYLNEKGEVLEVPKEYRDKWFNQSAPSKKQKEAGVEKEIKPRNLNLDNLIYFQHGKNIYDGKLNKEILDLLNLELV